MVVSPFLQCINLMKYGEDYRLEAGSNKNKSKHSKRDSNRSRSSSDRDKGSNRRKKAKAKLDAGLAAPVIKKKRKTKDEHQEWTGSQQKSTNQQKSSSTNNKSEESEVMGIFDKTQWENTKWAREADDFKRTKGASPGNGGIDKNQARKTAGNGHSANGSVGTTRKVTDTVFEGQQIVIANNVVPGEERQEIRTQGEQLLKKSNFMLILLSLEMLLTLVALCVWCTAAVNPTLPQVLAVLNMALVFIMATIIMAAEIFRFHVKKLEESPMVRYYIPYKWRFQLCSMNVIRIFMICADITIMALDNDLDTGSVAVLAMQPFHLILNGLHLVIALRPKTKQ